MEMSISAQLMPINVFVLAETLVRDLENIAFVILTNIYWIKV